VNDRSREDLPPPARVPAARARKCQGALVVIGAKGAYRTTFFMPLPQFRSAHRSARFLAVALAISIAVVSAVVSVSRISVLPPRLEPRDFQTAAAVTRMVVDVRRSGIADREAEWTYFNRVSTRADLVAHLMATDPAVERIARRAGVPPDRIAAVAPVGIEVAGPLTEPGTEARAREIHLARRPYRLEIHSRPGSPIVDIYAQAPSPAEAERLASGSIAGARDYFRAVATRTGPLDRTLTGISFNTRVQLLQLGRPHGVALSAGTNLKVAGLTFFLAFAIAYTALRTLISVRRGPRRTTGAAALVGVDDHDAWPRTTRVLPWMLAGFIAMLWLAPFDSLQLDVPAPIDLKLDRIVLPVIVTTWVLSLVAGGAGAPRLRATWIHAAVGGFVALAFLSVILDATSLNRSLELETSLKKLPLLLSYLTVFLMMSSVVRREEVAAFVKYTLVLAVLCALGMIWEDQHLRNVFFDWSQSALPNAFEIATTSSGWDTEGRRLVHGPAAHPLVAAAMLSLALPIAVLGLMHARQLGGRILYGLAAGALLVGVLSTQRKTGLVAPVAGVLTVAFFRRRELLRLTPVAVIVLIALVAVAPGTVAPVVDQFKPDRLTGANTVSDRASDYEAIRPDFGTHLALGRGYGSYQPVGHRILDSELLVRIVEMGALGVAALLFLGLSVVMCARRTIHSRDPATAPAALAGAAAAIIFLVVAVLFDSLAYPQVPYIFMYFAALVAVIAERDDELAPAAERAEPVAAASPYAERIAVAR
jgi:hypothetical protein